MRSRQSQGRPGTPVLPPNWETSHSIPVAKVRTGVCRIYPPTVGTAAEPVLDPDTMAYTFPDAPAAYVGSCRVQALSGRAGQGDTLGGQQVRTGDYLVAIDLDAGDIPVGSTVLVTETGYVGDPALAVLYVAGVTKGTVRWERDLSCVDDQSRVPEVTP